MDTAIHFGLQPGAEAPVIAALSELSASLESIDHALPGVMDSLLGFLQIGDGLTDVRTIRLDQTSTARTIELQIVLQPSQRLLGLISALRACDWERFFAEIKGHTCDSASGLEPPAQLNMPANGRR
jgi:hypothetical protein